LSVRAPGPRRARTDSVNAYPKAASLDEAIHIVGEFVDHDNDVHSAIGYVTPPSPATNSRSSQSADRKLEDARAS
jgi:hypothetical protein